MRRFHPDILARLDIEAEAIQTVVLERFDRDSRRISDHAAVWQPAPCPDDWGIHQPRRTP